MIPATEACHSSKHSQNYRSSFLKRIPAEYKNLSEKNYGFNQHPKMMNAVDF